MGKPVGYVWSVLQYLGLEWNEFGFQTVALYGGVVNTRDKRSKGKSAVGAAVHGLNRHHNPFSTCPFPVTYFKFHFFGQNIFIHFASSFTSTAYLTLVS